MTIPLGSLENMPKGFQKLLKDIRACTVCQKHLKHKVRPVLSVHPSAKILIIGQAPGKRVHDSGIPWDDPSGNRLREWMGVGRDTFYDESKMAIVPMGFCYPGQGTSGDLPPRPECAPLWHAKILQNLPHIQLTLLIGQYSQAYYLFCFAKPITKVGFASLASAKPTKGCLRYGGAGQEYSSQNHSFEAPPKAGRRRIKNKSATLTDTVKAWKNYAPQYLPLPHPSPRNFRWMANNPWFEKEILPYLQKTIKRILRNTS